MTTIYTTRYQASKQATSTDKIVKVCGGYMIIPADDYKIWKSQR